MNRITIHVSVKIWHDHTIKSIRNWKNITIAHKKKIYKWGNCAQWCVCNFQGGYYEVGYGGRDGAFGLSAGERFGRTDAASPQQVNF